MHGTDPFATMDPVTKAGFIYNQSSMSAARAKDAAESNAASMASALETAKTLDRLGKTAAGIERRIAASDERIVALEAQETRLTETVGKMNEAVTTAIASIADLFDQLRGSISAVIEKSGKVRDLEKDIESLYGKARQAEQMAENGLVTLNVMMKKQILLSRALDEIRGNLAEKVTPQASVDREKAERFLGGK